MFCVKSSMRTRHHPLKWPFCVFLAMTLFFGAVFLIPPEWIDFFFSPLNMANYQVSDRTDSWLNILPPPTIETATSADELPKETVPPRTAPPTEDPGWWTEGWRIQTVSETRALMTPGQVDSVAVILEALGVGLDFSRKALPDSLLKHQLMLLRIEDGFAFEDLKPFFEALTHARAMADKISREADMYDEHLGSQIMVPD